MCELRFVCFQEQMGIANGKADSELYAKLNSAYSSDDESDDVCTLLFEMIPQMVMYGCTLSILTISFIYFLGGWR